MKEWIIELLFPPRCPVCDAVRAEKKEMVCRKCRAVPRSLKEPLCRKCGKQLAGWELEYCSDCACKQHYYQEGAAVFEYTSIKKSLYRFKYAGRQEYAKYYAAQTERILSEKIRKWNPDALVPVPIHASKHRERGYNQAEVFAKELGKRMNIPVEPGIIKRVRKTVPQKQLDDKERQNNLKKAFKICRNDVKLSTIVIIDDIYTTGSTVDAVAKEFLQAGVKEVNYIALAIGKGL